MSKNIELAKECGDVEIDRRGRETYSFDNHGIERFANLVEQRTLKAQVRLFDGSEPIKCLHCGQATMHSGNVCYGCAQSTTATSNIKDKP